MDAVTGPERRSGQGGDELRNFEVRNPATGEVVGRYPDMGRDQVDRVVAAARQMAGVWAQAPFRQRKKILRRAAAVIAADADRYAAIVAAENGKTPFDALMTDIFPTAELLKYYSEKLDRFLAPEKVSPGIMFYNRKAWYQFEPRGVVGVISPWNYPLSLAAGPVISAVAAGNSVVLKPSSQTVASGMIIREVLTKGGLPEEVVQVVTGGGSTAGRFLAEHEGLDMLFFTGSTAVGRELAVSAARRLIPVVMELGGKDMAIVTKNADLDRAARAVVWGAFVNSGQTCIGIETALVERPVYDEFAAKVKALAEGLRLGRGPGEVGSMTMADQLAKVEDQVRDATDKGAKVLVGGRRDETRAGLYFPPTVITEVTSEMKLMKDETFGPVLRLIPYDRTDEAVKIANGTGYGLSGAVFSRDSEEARSIVRRLNTGSVSINDTLLGFAVESLPFGGRGESGVGRYHGKEGLRAFCHLKSVTEYQGRAGREPWWYPLSSEGEEMVRRTMSAFFSRNPFTRMVNLFRVARGMRRFAKNRVGN